MSSAPSQKAVYYQRLELHRYSTVDDIHNAYTALAHHLQPEASHEREASRQELIDAYDWCIEHYFDYGDDDDDDTENEDKRENTYIGNEDNEVDEKNNNNNDKSKKQTTSVKTKVLRSMNYGNNYPLTEQDPTKSAHERFRPTERISQR
jgi:tRNA U34 5-carboxymethylaminomethyl modifying GTPase MnmE/TrmE